MTSVSTTTHLRGAVEAILMVADQPVSTEELAATLGCPTEEMADLLAALAGEYTERGHGFDLRELGDGWRFYSHPDHADVVEKFVRDGQTAKLTKAALETLAVIAYRQPVSRGRIASIRGVNVDGVVRTLLTRGLIEEAGRDEETTALLYQTTSFFLERIGLKSISELPPLAPYLPEGEEFESLIEGDQ